MINKKIYFFISFVYNTIKIMVILLIIYILFYYILMDSFFFIVFSRLKLSYEILNNIPAILSKHSSTNMNLNIDILQLSPFLF